MVAPKAATKPKEDEDFVVTWSVVNSDPERAASTEGIPAPPPNMYKAKVTDIKVGYKMEDGEAVDGSQRFEVTAQLVDAGPHTGWAGRDYIGLENPKSEWKLDQFLLAFGQATTNKREGKSKKQDFLGKEVMVKIVQDSWTPKPTEAIPEPEPRVTAKIGGWYKLNKAKLGKIADLQAAQTETIEATSEEVEEEVVDDEDITSEQITELGATADAGDYEDMEADAGKAAAMLTELAEKYGEDINNYGPWADLAEAIVALKEVEEEGAEEEVEGEEGEEEATEEEAADDTANDYSDWAPDDLRTELKGRGLSTAGPPSALLKRLQESDLNPFKS